LSGSAQIRHLRQTVFFGWGFPASESTRHQNIESTLILKHVSPRSGLKRGFIISIGRLEANPTPVGMEVLEVEFIAFGFGLGTDEYPRFHNWHQPILIQKMTEK
jgi:hypothetical protein